MTRTITVSTTTFARMEKAALFAVDMRRCTVKDHTVSFPVSEETYARLLAANPDPEIAINLALDALLGQETKHN